MVLVVIILIGAFLVVRGAIVGQIKHNIKDADYTEDSLQAQAGCTPPSISNIAVTNLTSTGATISWTTNQASTSQVKLSSDNSLNWLAIRNTPVALSGVTSHTYQLPLLKPSRTYYYRVRSSNGSCQKTSKTYSFATLGGGSNVNTPTVSNGGADTTAPSAPSGLSTVALTSTSLILRWNASIDPNVGGQSSGVKNYEVYGPAGICNAPHYNGLPSAGFCGFVAHSGIPAYSININGLVPNTTYNQAVGSRAGFVVVAFDNAGNHSSSPTSPRFSVTTPSTISGTTPDTTQPPVLPPTPTQSPSQSTQSASCANTGTLLQQRQMWIWKEVSSIINPSSSQFSDLVNWITAKKVNMIYIYTPASFITSNTTSLQNFIDTMWNSYCTRVQFLDGDIPWATPPYTSAIAFANAAKNFKNSAVASGHVAPYGINVDVEPYSQLSSDTGRSNYLGMYTAMRSALSGTGLKIVGVIPRWYDTNTSIDPSSSVRMSLMKAVIDATDEIAVMNYVTNAANFSADVSVELQYSQQVGHKIIIAAETINLSPWGGSNTVTSHWGLSCSALNATINGSYSSIVAFAPTMFAGYAIHDYYQLDGSGWKYLCP
ncbi:MAG: hypothetical protein RL641_26 [Candidatus Parcubacteria bacterium]